MPRPNPQPLPLPCPVCATAHGGELVIRKTRRGRTFYGCSRYPECDFTSWKKPAPQPCPNCGGLLVETSRNKVQCIACSNSYRTEELPPVDAPVVTQAAS